MLQTTRITIMKILYIIDRYSGKKKQYTASQFQLLLGAEYISHLEFEDKNLLKSVKKWSKHYADLYLNTPEEKWQAALIAKEIRSGYIADISVGWINDNIGYGAITNRDIKKDTYIGEYTGVVQRKTQTYFTSNDYLWEHVPPPYDSMILIKDYFSCCINAKYKGNYTRFINHSNDNNLETRYIFCEGLLHVCFMSNIFIPAGTQLTYHYGPKYWKKRKKKQDLI